MNLYENVLILTQSVSALLTEIVVVERAMTMNIIPYKCIHKFRLELKMIQSKSFHKCSMNITHERHNSTFNKHIFAMEHIH